MPKTAKSKSLGSVLITGGAKRIGRSIALYLAKQGYSIVLHYHNSAKDALKLSREIKSHHVRCGTFRADLASGKSVCGLIAKVKKSFPDLRFLINNASIFEKSTLRKADLKDFEREFAIHLRAPLILSSEFAQIVAEGAIINILDTNVNRAKVSHVSYLLSKKSLSELTRLAALELAPKIRVNAVAPGLILPPENHGPEYLDRLAQNIPLKRRGEPNDIAKAIHFLLENTYITGQTIFVDGGEHLK